jgi:hypothetical protein
MKQERKMVDITFSSHNGSHKIAQILILVWAKMAFDVVREWRRQYHRG